MIGGLVTVLVGHLVETAKLRAYAAALYAAAAASLLFAFIFALGSLRHWIAVRYGSEYPDLWIAAGFVVLAIPFVGFGIWMQNQRPKRHPAASIALLAGPPAARLAARAVGPRMVAVGVVLIASLIVGRSISGRRDI
jgi:hypothetical protein